MTAELQLQLRPEWQHIAGAADKVAAYFRGAGLKPDTVDALMMVASELLENAIKYGSFSRADAEVRLRASASATAAEIEVFNPTGPDSDMYLRRLDAVVQWLRGFQDPFEAYLERLREVSGQSLDSRESGLGVVRIAYEGRAVVDFVVDSRGRLSVSAVRRL